MDFKKFNSVCKIFNEFPTIEKAVRNSGNTINIAGEIFGIANIIDNFDTFIQKYDIDRDILRICTNYQYFYNEYLSYYGSNKCRESINIKLTYLIRQLSESGEFTEIVNNGDNEHILRIMETFAKYLSYAEEYRILTDKILNTVIRETSLLDIIKSKILNRIISYYTDSNYSLLPKDLSEEFRKYINDYAKRIMRDRIKEIINLAQNTYTIDQVSELISEIKNNAEVCEFFVKVCNINPDNIKVSMYNKNASESDITAFVSTITDASKLKEAIDNLVRNFDSKITEDFIITFVKKCIIENPKIKDRNDKIMKRNIVHHFIDSLICSNRDKNTYDIENRIESGKFNKLFTELSDYFYDAYYITAQMTQSAYENNFSHANVVLAKKMIRQLVKVDEYKFIKNMLTFIKDQSSFPKTCRKSISHIIDANRLCKEIYKSKIYYKQDNYHQLDNFDAEVELIRMLSANENRNIDDIKYTDKYARSWTYDYSIRHTLAGNSDAYYSPIDRSRIANYILTGNINYDTDAAIARRIYRNNYNNYNYLKSGDDAAERENMETIIKNVYKTAFVIILTEIKDQYTQEQLASIIKYVEEKCGNDIVLYHSPMSSILEHVEYKNSKGEFVLFDLENLDILRNYISFINNLGIFKNFSIPSESILIPQSIYSDPQSTIILSDKYNDPETFVKTFFNFGCNGEYNKYIISSILPDISSNIVLANQSRSITELLKRRRYADSLFLCFDDLDNHITYYYPTNISSDEVFITKLRDNYVSLVKLLHTENLISDDDFSKYNDTIDQMFENIKCELIFS